MKTIRVLVVDDHAIVRAGLRALLEAAGDMLVVGEANNGRQAVLEAGRLWPDVVLLDLGMPLLNGVQAARQIAHEAPDARVLVLSGYSDEQHLREAIEAGVAGFLLKESASDDLLEAVRETDSRGAFFSPRLLQRLLKARQEGPPNSGGATTRAATLTEREAEVLQLVAERYANKQIADVLGLSVKTVEKHRQTLMTKLRLHNTANLTRHAVFSGAVESNRPPIAQSRPGPAGARARRKEPAGV